MYTLAMHDSNLIQVQSKKFQYTYATDGSQANPLEATYAALAGCAGVYTLKVCKKMGKTTEGIVIQCKSVVKPENPSQTAKWITQVSFPQGWSADEKTKVLTAINNCAVKELIHNGHNIEFITEDHLAE